MPPIKCIKEEVPIEFDFDPESVGASSCGVKTEVDVKLEEQNPEEDIGIKILKVESCANKDSDEHTNAGSEVETSDWECVFTRQYVFSTWVTHQKVVSNSERSYRTYNSIVEQINIADKEYLDFDPLKELFFSLCKRFAEYWRRARRHKKYINIADKEYLNFEPLIKIIFSLCERFTDYWKKIHRTKKHFLQKYGAWLAVEVRVTLRRGKTRRDPMWRGHASAGRPRHIPEYFRTSLYVHGLEGTGEAGISIF